ncbi:MAG: hypothetical protein JXI33_08355 [Candidatus Aminicenantes bacterium]|nr:hypothetical protein [Candidatus Aminicenantes bacterium]
MELTTIFRQNRSRLPVHCCIASLFFCTFLGAAAPIEHRKVKIASHADIIEFEQADERLDGALSDDLEQEYESVLFITGDLELERDFLDGIAEINDEEVDLIVIDGDLDVRGRIALYDETPGLFVTGATRARTLEGGECEIRIQDGTFDFLVYGDGDEGVIFAGKVGTRWVINADHELRIQAGDAIWIDNEGDSEEYNFNSENIEDSFVEEVLDGDRIDVEAFLERLMEGKPVLKRQGEED